ncbi:hypothetical protein ACFWYW_58570, partial [Nonomuraea sp. NPDC059023]
AGIDGIAVWALTCLTAVLSSMDARSLPEAIFRLAAPLVAAWLWERGMAIERHRIRGTGRINWRLTPERILVRLGLAEARDRSAADVDAQRWVTRIGLAAKRAKQLRDTSASDRKQRTALARLDRVFERAAQHIGLGRDPEVQERVRAEVAALFSVSGLLDVPASSEWMPSPEAPTPTIPVRRIVVLRTEARTEPVIRVVRLARQFSFTSEPAQPAVHVLRRGFTFRPGTVRTAPPRTVLVFRNGSVSADRDHIDRTVFVREITAEILTAAAQGDKWGPDYDTLQARSGRKRSWCEKAVADARKAVFPTDLRTDDADRAPALAGSLNGSPTS